ncbi:MAG: hypothetical protein ACM3X0_12455 [Bacteroidota bacterium]
MLHAILESHLLLAASVLLFLFLVVLVIMRGHKLRNGLGTDRRKRPRPGVDRRA